MSSEGIPAALRASRHVSAFAYPESAARALGRVADRAEWLRRPQGAIPALDGIDHARAAAVVAEALARSDDAWLDPAATRELLLAYGVPLVPERVAPTVDDAVAAARASRSVRSRYSRSRAASAFSARTPATPPGWTFRRRATRRRPP
jgi:acyl-CoA synthetase (NDP forming)